MIRAALEKAKAVFWFVPGFLLWAAFPPMGETADCLFALAPLLWLSRQGEPGVAVRRWFQSGFVFWFATLSWMPAIVKNGGPWPLVALGWGALAAYCALFFAAFGWLSAVLWGLVRPRAYGWRLAAIFIGEPILWAGLELVRSRLFGGFAWNHLGVPAVTAGFGAPAAVGGVYLLSMAVVLINGTIASIAERVLAPWQAYRRRRKLLLAGGTVEIDPSAEADAPAFPPLTRGFETILPFLLLVVLFRAAAPEEPPSADASPVLRVGLLQRNFPCVFKGPAGDPAEEYARLLGAVAPLAPDLLVLPESALCEIGRIGTASAARFAAWACDKAGAKALLAGGSRRAGGKEFNSAALYARDAAPQVYDKVHLVPFGEFIPGDKLIPAPQNLAPVGSCTPGTLKLLTAGGVKLGVAICFEDTDSAQMRRLAALGAQALVFITNDSWFSHSDETVQHAWQAVARALETGLPVIRVGNSGVTGVVTPQGRASWLLNEKGRPLVDRQGSLFERVPVAAVPRPTPYVRWGDAPLAVLFCLTAGLIVFFRKVLI
jgi:apolipoprotein N-acyltransferase